ncbi:MAG: DUF4442 domain-containing protein [Gammaproteobacteria bacterium]
MTEGDSGFLVGLADEQKYTNHLGTVHASALMAVAESGSGAFLAKQFASESGLIPLVRRFEAKFRRPATGRVSARCIVKPIEVQHWYSELRSRNRVLASIPTEVVDASDSVVLSATVEWIITRG